MLCVLRGTDLYPSGKVESSALAGEMAERSERRAAAPQLEKRIMPKTKGEQRKL